ncbi:hypothetical protein MPL1_12286 [Methylophaga lonarensis MPL]|uniref:Uncharacterized protein n=1 Tax=Methylophaga lonarensis MPL TaxID=1286106 RepID=M7NTE1_9GAMM|nr:hypothetical protein [Methylophaga lonarensis]EMR12048.1 hypothetical protein MPL1_12286 [Methylophaga lonarensis MPL]
MTSDTGGIYEALIPISNWNILIETDVTGKTTERLIGLNESDGLGHISEKIFHFDEKTKVALMETGPRYQVNGAPGLPHSKTIVTLTKRIGFKRTLKLLGNGRVDHLKFRYPLS